jgi:hypothetical protein
LIEIVNSSPAGGLGRILVLDSGRCPRRYSAEKLLVAVVAAPAAPAAPVVFFDG